MISESEFIESLNEDHFNGVIDTIRYYINNYLCTYIKNDSVEGAKNFIKFIHDNGTIPHICNSKNINIPDHLDRYSMERLIQNRCDYIKEYLLDSICLYMPYEEACRLRSLAGRSDIFDWI